MPDKDKVRLFIIVIVVIGGPYQHVEMDGLIALKAKEKIGCIEVVSAG